MDVASETWCGTYQQQRPSLDLWPPSQRGALCLHTPCSGLSYRTVWQNENIPPWTGGVKRGWGFLPLLYPHSPSPSSCICCALAPGSASSSDLYLSMAACLINTASCPGASPQGGRARPGRGGRAGGQRYQATHSSEAEEMKSLYGQQSIGVIFMVLHFWSGDICFIYFHFCVTW